MGDILYLPQGNVLCHLWPVDACSGCLLSPFDTILGLFNLFLDFSYDRLSWAHVYIYPRSPGSFYCGKKYLENRRWVLGMFVATGVLLIVSRPFY